MRRRASPASAIGNILLGRDLSDGDLDFKLDRKTAQASGTAKLAGIPVSLTWQEALQAKAPVRTRYDVTAQLDAAQRRTLGLDMLEDYVGGPVGVTASYSLGAAKNAQARLSRRSTCPIARFHLPWFGWSKPAPAPATARITLDACRRQGDRRAEGQPHRRRYRRAGVDWLWGARRQQRHRRSSRHREKRCAWRSL